MSGYPQHPPGYGYGAPPPPSQQHGSQPYGSAPYGAPPPPQGYATPYGAPPPPQPHGQSPYGAQPYGAAPSAPPYGPKPPKDQTSGASAATAYPPSSQGYSPFAALVPSAFPPGTDPNVIACFQIADQDGSGVIDDKELQRALSSYSQSFSLRTVHLLMYLFTNSNSRKIG